MCLCGRRTSKEGREEERSKGGGWGMAGRQRQQLKHQRPAPRRDNLCSSMRAFSSAYWFVVVAWHSRPADHRQFRRPVPAGGQPRPKLHTSKKTFFVFTPTKQAYTHEARSPLYIHSSRAHKSYRQTTANQAVTPPRSGQTTSATTHTAPRPFPSQAWPRINREPAHLRTRNKSKLSRMRYVLLAPPLSTTATHPPPTLPTKTHLPTPSSPTLPYYRQR